MVTLRRCSKYFLAPILERTFVYSRYEEFLESISDSSRYRIVPLKDLPSEKTKARIAISLRHDVDWDLRSALEMAKIEHEYRMKATYFILHTARYYGVTKKDYVMHKHSIIPILQKIQNQYGHEIGWHNDLVTLECVYGIDPKSYLQQELQWLRRNGISIVGTAAHGSIYCRKFGFHNNYFFHDFPETLGEFPSNRSVNIKGRERFISKAYLRDFGLEYEAYHLPNVHSQFADCSSGGRNGRRWHPADLSLDGFSPGDRIVILTHPSLWGHSVYRKYLQLASFLLK